ncbi:MAG: DUF3108 domain-containing protein [Rhodobacteraceae bacterium]|nr:DUF3108 domain-containing protein [Paracoccaceae bacterium]
MRRALPVLPVAVLCLLAGAPGIRAESATDAGSFTVTVAGIKAGTFRFKASLTGKRYRVTSQAATAGLGALLKSFTMDSRVEGVAQGRALRPQSYVSKGQGAREDRGAEIAYDGAMPNVVQFFGTPDPEAPTIPAEDLIGTVDTLTALYALLRDTPVDQVCDLKLRLFDGHRLSHVTLTPGRDDDGAVTCDGVYHRVAGYPPKEVKKRRKFPFTVVYDALDATTLRPREFTMDSPFGPARMTRD